MKKGIIGAGGFGREVFWSLPLEERINTVFFVDDLYWKDNDDIIYPLSKFNPDEYEIIIAVGSPISRKKIVESLPNSTRFFTHIHKSAQLLAPDIKIGEGSIICANSIITTNVTIGKHCHLNLDSTIGHDTVIGDFFTTAPGAKISGNCKIGDFVYFGTNSSVREKIEICNNVTIGLNAGVVKNIIEPGTYVGVPVKKI
jgi:sugar O-acyltransferase (sialic acid O-acetyltransferase NeuD family)